MKRKEGVLYTMDTALQIFLPVFLQGNSVQRAFTGKSEKQDFSELSAGSETTLFSGHGVSRS